MRDDEDRGNLERSQQYLANQRTFLSWVRTSIALIGLGFAIERFSIFIQQFQGIIDDDETSNIVSITGYEYSALIGIGMIALGTGLTIYSAKNYLDTNTAIASGGYTPKNNIVYTTTAIILGLGIIMIIFLIGQLL